MQSIIIKEKDQLVPKVTQKRQKVIMLPEIKSYIQQPNRVTETSYDYKLVQKKNSNCSYLPSIGSN